MTPGLARAGTDMRLPDEGEPEASGDRPRPWLTCIQVEHDLRQVESGLQALVGASDPLVDEVCGQLLRAGGKLMRPALLLLGAQFGDPARPVAIRMAVAMELMHVATLYHDDIVDLATMRRGVASANARWGNKLAAFGGAFLLSKAIETFASAGDDVNAVVSEAVHRVWNGQMREMESVKALDIDEARLFSVIEQKTAAFFELPCELGALVCGATTSVRASLAAYGRNLGVAFQLIDDVMDIATDKAEFGKEPGIDLREGVYTLPVLYTLHSGTPEGRRLREILARPDLNGEDAQEALALVRCTGSLARTSGTATCFAQRAIVYARRLPNGDARRSLLRLADAVVQPATGI